MSRHFPDWMDIPNYRNLTRVNLDHDSWLKERKRGIGSSDVAAVLGISPWSSPLMVYRQKVGLDPDITESPSMKEGHAMEPVAVAEYEEDTGATCYEVPFLYDNDHPWRVASLDRIAIMPDDSLCVVEVKWSAHGFDGIPPHYMTQCLWQMGITGIHQCVLLVRTPGKRAEPRVVEWDADLFNSMCEAVDAFWHGHVLLQIEPPATTNEERTDKALARMMGRDLTPKMEPTEIMLAVESELAACDRAAKDAKKKSDSLKVQIAEQMAQHGVKSIVFPDKSKWTFVEKAGNVAWKDYAIALGGDEKGAEKYRGSPSRYVLAKHAGVEE